LSIEVLAEASLKACICRNVRYHFSLEMCSDLRAVVRAVMCPRLSCPYWRTTLTLLRDFNMELWKRDGKTKTGKTKTGNQSQRNCCDAIPTMQISKRTQQSIWKQGEVKNA